MHGAAVFLHRLFLNDAQDVQSGGFCAADLAGAGTTRAGDGTAFAERRTQALP